MTAPLDGLTVIDLSNTLTGTQMSQVLTDFGAKTVHVEPPGGSPLREQPAWPFWGRGKMSIALDLRNADDVETAHSLISNADIVIETWRPGVAERLGLSYEDLAGFNPRLIYASVTGFGRDNPLSHLKGYEPIVMAKIGGLDAFSDLSDRPGPSFVSTPYCSWSAGQLGLHGILAALVERESSGLGQRVESSLVQGLVAHDTWNWLIRMLTERYTGAFTSAPVANYKDLVPNSPLFFRLLVALSADGRWMQFSQSADRLWLAWLKAVGLEWTLEDPILKDGTSSEDPQARVQFWERCLRAVRTKTYDEWLEVFDREPHVWAEIYRSGTELLHHPQLVHDPDTVVRIEDPEMGMVLQPGPLVRMTASPAKIGGPAPTFNQHGSVLRATLPTRRRSRPSSEVQSGPPLKGVTIIELGNFYAAPFGATILAEFGARVIKVEQLAGDPMRTMVPFPEVGGVKVLQGKESVAVDFTTDEGREIVLELVRRADVVLQTFRAGVAERHGYTAADLLAVNPDLVYLSAAGYGTGGPYGNRPAFAPTIGAASGLGYRNVGGPLNVPQGPHLTLDEVKRHSMRLSMASMAVANADGFSALGVGTALLLGIVAKARGAPGQSMATSMLSTMSNVLSEDMVEYEGRSPTLNPDPELLGQGPLYRLYPTAEGWLFLAAPTRDEWDALADVLGLPRELGEDSEGLSRRLREIFATKTAAEWELALTKVDVACVEVVAGPVDKVVMAHGGLGSELGIVAEMTHPVLETYLRLGPLARLSRSESVLGPAPLCGQQTVSVLVELGYDTESIAGLRAAGVIGCV